MIDVNEFDQIRIGLATADAIRMWSNGEVKKPFRGVLEMNSILPEGIVRIDDESPARVIHDIWLIPEDR